MLLIRTFTKKVSLLITGFAVDPEWVLCVQSTLIISQAPAVGICNQLLANMEDSLSTAVCYGAGLRFYGLRDRSCTWSLKFIAFPYSVLCPI